MPVRVVCPTCATVLSVKDEHAGRAVKCPKCNSVIQAAQPTAAPTQTKGPGAPPLDSISSLLAPPQLPDELGRLGPYRILGELGRGGMGTVFRADDPGLNRHVAIKVMLPQFAADPLAKERFLREARAQARVEHDHVANIYQVAEHAGVPYIVMPLLKGQSLAAALRSRPQPPLRQLLRIGREIAEGLAAAHAVGLIHRDIKPANVWLEGPKQRVKILDFGLARNAALNNAGEALTHTGAILGTPAYMSPEQARGQRVTLHTDLFSLGIVLYQMATGQMPFTGESVFDVMAAVVNHQPPPAHKVEPELPPALGKLIARLLEKAPSDRPTDAPTVVAELAEIDRGLDAGTEPDPEPGSGRTRAGSDDDEADRRRRPREEEDEDEKRGRGRSRSHRREGAAPPGREKPKKKSNNPLILTLLGVVLFSCCGTGGFCIYWASNNVGDMRDAETGYARLTVGPTTRAQADTALGKGKTATVADLRQTFGSEPKSGDWVEKAALGRVVIWQFGSYIVLAAFHPNTEGDARLQAKAWGMSSVLRDQTGELNDATFLTKYPPPKTSSPAFFAP